MAAARPFLSRRGAPAPPPPPALAATWIGSANYWQGRPHGAPIALVVHTMQGYLGSCDAEFNDPATEVSAHYGVALDGRVHQYVKLADRAWANGIREAGNAWDAARLPNVNPNDLTVSIETEDDGSPTTVAVSDAQDASVLAIGRFVVATLPSVRLLLGHRDISPLTRPHCPGDRWIASGRSRTLAAALGLDTLS